MESFSVPIELLLQERPALGIDETSKSKGWNDSTHANQRCTDPISANAVQSVLQGEW